jgi:hypothetical protein
MRNESEKYLNNVKVKAIEKDMQIKTEIISSKDISGGILDFAEENNIDLIVIGTRGRSGFKRLLLGSVINITCNNFSYNGFFLFYRITLDCICCVNGHCIISVCGTEEIIILEVLDIRNGKLTRSF